MDPRTALDLLGHEHRRAIVAALDETAPASRDRLVSALLARTDDDPGRSTRRRLHRVLDRDHLPRLADADVVTVDGETVERADEFDPLADYLDEYDWDAWNGDLSEMLSAFYS